MILDFWMWSFKPTFSLSLSLSSRGSLVLCFLPLKWYHPHIWGGYFSCLSWFQQWPQDWRSALIPIPKKSSTKDIRQLDSSPLLVRSCLKSCMLGFSISQIKNFQVSKLGLERQTDQRSNCQHLLDHRESKGIPEKHLLLFHQWHQSFWLCGP